MSIKDSISKSSYRNLEIYNLAYQLAIAVHKMTMKLPKIEMYEQGSQIRRASQSIKNNIVEGYGRRKYKADFIKFLIYSHASCDETISQLEMINTLYKNETSDLLQSYDLLGRKINRYIQYVEKHWNSKDIKQ